MSLPLLATAIATGMILAVLLTWTRRDARFRFWPTPRPWSWESILFWSLFRVLNLSMFAIAALEWQPWSGLSPDRLAGVALGIAGAGLYAAAIHALGRKNLYCGRDGLITGGIYGWTRNPQYAAAIPAYFGLALASRSAWALVMALLLWLVFLLMALAEEPWLEAAYGEDYRAYKARVARFYTWRPVVAAALGEMLRLERALKEARAMRRPPAA